MAEEDKTPTFSIQSNNIGFSNKSKDIFAQLEVLESKHKDHEKTRADNSFSEESGYQKHDPSEEETETIKPAFKKPDFKSSHNRPRHYERNDKYSSPYRNSNRGSGRGQGHKRHHTPDHTTHPEKWTKYSLEDVGDEDMSDSSNSRAAFAFLEERRKLREGNIKAEAVNTSETACSKGVFTFKKPTKSTKISDKKSLSIKSSDSAVSELKEENEDIPNVDDNVKDKSDSTSKSDVKVGFKSRKNAGRKNLRMRASGDSDED